MKLPTWSSVNGQDDVSWYTATKQADGTYKLFVNASNQKIPLVNTMSIYIMSKMMVN